MMISAQELDGLLEVCRKHGVRQLCVGSLSVTIGEPAKQHDPKRLVPDPSDGVPAGVDRRLIGLMQRGS